LATFKVDQSFDNSSDIVLGSYAAVYSYSSRVFKKEVPNGENAYGVVSDFAGQTKESRTEKEITEIPIYETIENFRTVLKPIYDNVKKEQVIKVENPEKIPINRGLIGNFLWGNEEIVYTEEVQVHQTTSFEQIDMEEVEVSDGVIQKRTGYEKKLIGLRYLKGGYDIIKGILAIGLGVESLPDENIDNFNRIYGAGEKEVNLKIGNLKSRIEQIISNSDSKKAENEIISILMQALL
jgi:hypothetical protein